MTKSKFGGLSKLPSDQVCSFVIGPVSSWFMPNAIDLWTQPKALPTTSVAGDTSSSDTPYYISYFVYGSIGCFCVGEIQHRPELTGPKQNSSTQPTNQVGGIVNRLIDVRDDNSRVSCVRFQRNLSVPLILALTESGSLVIYDHFLSRNLIHFKKTEVLKTFVDLSTDHCNEESAGGQNKRARFNVTQQINSCTWPDANNIFLGISLLKEKKCLLLRLKLNNVLEWRGKLYNDSSSKQDLISAHQLIELELDNFSSPICLIESAMLDDKTCLIAAAMDDGFIIVTSLSLESGKTLRTIKLGRRHNDQICSMSLYLGNTKKYPLGLLASVSRDGLVLVWDIENEFYFADYLAIQSTERGSSAKINWFALRFIDPSSLKQLYLVVSNVDSGLTLLEIPENARSKIRLKETTTTTTSKINSKSKKKKKNHNHAIDQDNLKHSALIFNIEYDQQTQVILTSSLDGNHILWKTSNSMQTETTVSLEVKQQFLIPAMPNNARTHMLRHSPIREDLMCMALGKAGVRFHSIGERLIDSKFDMTPSCSLVARRLVKANVSPTSLAWHPNHEYRLCVGTLEGTVYRIDITPHKATLTESELCNKISNKELILKVEQASIDDSLGVDYKPIVKKEEKANGNHQQQQRPKTDGIYSICWGPHPACSDDITKHAIYAIGSISHTLFIYYSKKDNSEKLSNYLDEFLDTSLPEAAGKAAEVAWKSSMDMMALGTTDGRVLILTYLDESHQERSNHKLFRHLMTIQGPLGSVYVQCMVWHPTTDKDDPNYYKIVVSSNESPAYVFDLRMTLSVSDLNEQLRNGCTNSGGEVALLSSHTNKLEAHEKAITDISWNPHEPSQLATCSFDRTCFVWSLDGSHMDARVIAKFCARDRLFTVDWSLVDENLIYTSGHDSIIWAWRPTENLHSIVSV